VRFTAIAALFFLAAGWCYSQAPALRSGAHAARQQSPSHDPAREAFEQRRSGQQLALRATVLRILTDDRDGSRHQRFIIRSDSGITVLIAHNIDLAPRLAGLAVGDSLMLSGEYEWNAQGGLLHWTHRDPAGRHRPGYIEWKGRRYE
jgi:hypothetical protein